MILLTKPNQEEFYLNPFHIEKIEVSNFTIITLTNGKKYIVENGIDNLKEQIDQFWKNALNLGEKKNNFDNSNN